MAARPTPVRKASILPFEVCTSHPNPSGAEIFWVLRALPASGTPPSPTRSA